MANAIADYGAQQWVGAMFGIDTLPSYLYAALTTNEPQEQWDGNLLYDIEPWGQTGYTGSVYARQQIGFGPSNWVLSDSGIVVNANDISFGVPDVDWGTVTHFALTDDPTAGNLWLYGEFAVPQQLDDTVLAVIPAGNIVISLGNLLSSISAS